MKRIITLMMVLVLSATVASANPISRETARQKAAAFLGGKQKLAPVADGKRLSRQRRASAKEESEYYVFNIGTREGFVIISGDDRTEPVLGYSDKGTFDYETLPPGLQDMLEFYTTQLSSLRLMPESEWAARSSQRKAATVPTHPKVEQLMTCTWNQRGPYNNLCPKDNDGNRSVTGCVATAMAQILYYHRDMMVTETQADIPGYETWSHKIKVDGIPAGQPLDWDNMQDNGGSSTKQHTAVANLMLYCGVSVQMDYTSGSSGAQIGAVPGAMINVFGMNTTARHIWKDDMSDVDWDAQIYDELAAGRPVYMGGYTGDYSVGHAFVCDGYDGNRRYHINWGWGGSSDGYYMLTNLTPGQQGAGGNDSGQGYSTGPNIVIGIEPVNFGPRAIKFSDATVRDICKAHFDADGDGQVTYGEAAEVTDLGTAFKDQNIRQFPELYYFTSLRSIADDAFNGCAALQSLRLPKKGLMRIGARAFKGCAKLSSLTMPVSVTAIGAEAFSGCKLLSGLKLPDGIKAIEAGTFRECAKLDEITLPISVQAIGEGAFSDCTNLKLLTVKTFSPSILAMGSNVFSGCQLGDATLSVMQSTEEWFSQADQWRDFGTIVVERELSGGHFDALEAEQTYYIYHVGTGQYLSRGEAYGTQAVVSTEPMRFEIHHPSTQPEGIYYLKNQDSSLASKLLFRTNTDGNVGKGVQACFVDGGTLNASAFWKIQKVANSPYGDNIYTIQAPAGNGISTDRYLGVQPDHESGAAEPTYGAYPDVLMSNDETACLWRLVKYDAEKSDDYNNASQLGNLLTIARKMGVNAKLERTIYADIQSSAADIRRAQQSLRRRMNYVDFADVTGQQTFVGMGDTNSDGELSRSEAAVMKDLDIDFVGCETVTDMDAIQYFTGTTALRKSMFSGCKKLIYVTLPPNIQSIGTNCFQNCKALQRVTVLVADPATIEVPSNAFAGVPLADCTLRVPQGSEELYRQADVWKGFGHIVGIRLDNQGKSLEQLIKTAAATAIDVSAEQAVYDNAASTEAEVSAAIASLRQKLHYIDIADKKAENICLENWDTSLDGELTLEEAAEVKTIGEVFRNVSGLTVLDVLRHFTGLTEIPSSAFRGSSSLKTVYVPAGVKAIGEYAFTGCNELKYLVLMNGETMIPQDMLGLPTQGTTVFVPATVISAYQSESAWADRCNVIEFTDKPVVSAEGTRQYGATAATITMSVSGAPVIGEATYTCAENDDLKAPVGKYPITVGQGTITDATVELREGVLTVEPATIRVSAKSYTRNVGEPNPEFAVTYLRFRNGENTSVLTRQPDITCEATIDSPAGEYPIIVSGAEAQNYVFTYSPGTLTVVNTLSVSTPKAEKGSDTLYDLQGRRIAKPQRGIYIRDRRKVIVR